ncbi:MAG: type I restriction enzyme HsdR N-terminal domain-containing protein [Ferruginibacter sp.]|nr:type I restriction enzyme HsdR N-terminal domain-containing protein [Ferruginibacter sp.]
MILIEYPKQKPAIRSRLGRDEVFCLSRKKWVTLTPEEWVRQNFLLYLSLVLNYPPALLSVEKTIALGERKRRFDIVAFNRNGEPCILVECKKMDVPLSEKVMDQLLAYRSVVQTNIFVITNGVHCIAFQVINNRAELLNHLPPLM